MSNVRKGVKVASAAAVLGLYGMGFKTMLKDEDMSAEERRQGVTLVVTVSALTLLGIFL